MKGRSPRTEVTSEDGGGGDAQDGYSDDEIDDDGNERDGFGEHDTNAVLPKLSSSFVVMGQGTRTTS